MRDWILYIWLRGGIIALRLLPLPVWLVLAKGFGWFYYYVAGKKNKRAFSHLKLAFPHRKPQQLKRIIRQMYQQFAQNFMEACYLPYIDERYVQKYVKVSGLNVVEGALNNKQGIIFLGCHAGSWELSNIACAMLFSAEGQAAMGGKENKYAILAQPQSRYKKLDVFLNALRESKGCRVIRIDELKKMVEHLSANHMLGLVADHGGKEGLPIEFFGKLAMTPTSSVKLAKKLGSKIILAFMRRINGPYHEMHFKPYDLVATGDAASDLQVNLTAINKIFENWIVQYPQEYLWFYKRWKHSPQRNILILSDAKAGHLKQSLALSDMISSLGLTVKSEVVEVKYKDVVYARLFSLGGLLFGPRFANLLLPFCLKDEAYQKVTTGAFDMVVSAGSSLAAVNLAIAAQTQAKTIAIMRPGIFPLRCFNLVIIPQHDQPPPRKNVLVTTGSLNAVTPQSIKKDFDELISLRPALNGLQTAAVPKIGLLIGGNSKNYTLTAEMATLVCTQLKKASKELNAYLFLTTSRRTPENVMMVLQSHLKAWPYCKLFVDAAVDNPSGTIGGIFYLSDVLVVSGESISMVSEAVASAKNVIVFQPRSLRPNNKVQRFLNSLSEKNHIFLVNVNELYEKLAEIIRTKPQVTALQTRSAVVQGLKKTVL